MYRWMAFDDGLRAHFQTIQSTASSAMSTNERDRSKRQSLRFAPEWKSDGFPPSFSKRSSVFVSTPFRIRSDLSHAAADVFVSYHFLFSFIKKKCHQLDAVWRIFSYGASKRWIRRRRGMHHKQEGKQTYHSSPLCLSFIHSRSRSKTVSSSSDEISGTAFFAGVWCKRTRIHRSGGGSVARSGLCNCHGAVVVLVLIWFWIAVWRRWPRLPDNNYKHQDRGKW